MDAESKMSAAMLKVVPYHCKELANHADLQPLVAALVSLQGDGGAINILDIEPDETQGFEAAIQFFWQLSNDPAIRAAAGTFGAAALGVFGKKFATWFWNFLWTRPGRVEEKQTLTSVICILPPQNIPQEQAFPLNVEIGIGPHDYQSAVYLPVGESQTELENRAATEFAKIGSVIESLRSAWLVSNIPPNLTYANMSLDRESGEYWINADHVQHNGMVVGYRGTVTPNGKLVWSRR